MEVFQNYLTKYLGTICARQLALDDFLGEGRWGADLEEGIFTYTPDKRFSIQLLGSESHHTDTWLWAWANYQSDFPAQLLQSINQIKQEHEVEEELFATPKFDLDPQSYLSSGHAVAIVCAGLAGDVCYYRGAYDGGALYFLITNVPPALLAPVTPERAMTVISQVISRFEVNHKEMARNFFQQQGYRLEHTSDTLRASTISGSMLTLQFNEQNLLVNMQGNIKPIQAT